MICPVDKKKLLLTLCPIYLLFYMGDAILSSYYSLYFIHNGLDAHQQSILLGLIPFCLFLGCFVLSLLAKGTKRTLWLFRICAAIETGLTLGFAFCHSYASLAVLTVLLSFFNGAPFAFLESHALLSIEGKKIRYATIRIFGTFGYIVSLALGYFLLRDLPFEQCYFFSAGFFFLALVLSFFATPAQEEKKEAEVQEPKRKLNRATVLLVISLVLINGALVASTYLLPVRLKGLGLADADFSIMRAFGIGVEALMLLLIPFFHRFCRKHKKAPFIITSLGFALAMSLVCFIDEPFLCGYLHLSVVGISKGFFFAYEMYLIEEVVGKSALSKALLLINGSYNLLGSLLNLVSSNVYLTAGFGVYFGILAGLEVLGFAAMMFIPLSKEAATEEQNG